MNFKVMTYGSTSFNRIVADKSHSVTLALEMLTDTVSKYKKIVGKFQKLSYFQGRQKCELFKVVCEAQNFRSETLASL